MKQMCNFGQKGPFPRGVHDLSTRSPLLLAAKPRRPSSEASFGDGRQRKLSPDPLGGIQYHKDGLFLRFTEREREMHALLSTFLLTLALGVEQRLAPKRDVLHLAPHAQTKVGTKGRRMKGKKEAKDMRGKKGKGDRAFEVRPRPPNSHFSFSGEREEKGASLHTHSTLFAPLPPSPRSPSLSFSGELSAGGADFRDETVSPPLCAAA